MEMADKGGCRGFDTSGLGSDLWPIGFDVDLALDSTMNRYSMASSNLATNQLGAAAAVSTSVGYNDVHQLFMQRIDDLQENDISQITDLTNSLPKGENDTAQSLLARLGCHDLDADLNPTIVSNNKNLGDSLFGPSANDGSRDEDSSYPFLNKSIDEPADVYGQVTRYKGKIVLQLRHFNHNTNYPMTVSECWLCKEKVLAGSQLYSHKHILQGLFHVNEEFNKI